MTGRYPYHVGLQSGSQYIPLTAPYGVPLDETFLPEKLKTSGYATHMVTNRNKTTLHTIACIILLVSGRKVASGFLQRR